jgi:hypothetical protein
MHLQNETMHAFPCCCGHKLAELASLLLAPRALCNVGPSLLVTPMLEEFKRDRRSALQGFSRLRFEVAMGGNL